MPTRKERVIVCQAVTVANNEIVNTIPVVRARPREIFLLYPKLTFLQFSVSALPLEREGCPGSLPISANDPTGGPGASDEAE